MTEATEATEVTETTETAAATEDGATAPQSAGAQPLATTRRVVLCGAGGAAALVLAGCSSSGSMGSDASAAGAPTGSGAGMGTPSAGMGAPSTGMGTPGASMTPSGAASAGSTASGTVLGKAADVPVGGGTVFADAKVVVTQAAAGQYKAFSAVCTHRGCTVSQVAGGKIMCPCHGSEFKIEDGSVAKGPATAALASVPVKVQNGTLVTGA
ncbi:Rieske (2Fe-2S) protein [Kitasatospora sp. LaBMicrA B282]|uniref:Rieske (2Fe-2S) protein n=1 Tax=Kitasatospora sp. LaBMicrA B282 TaxID=3420949 RepID=UPI003D0F88C2